MSFDVIIVGGGLAGMSAAIKLADHGRRVLVLETRKRLGGRATSFDDPRTGERLDNCQHVALGCCVNYLHFLDQLGALDRVDWTGEQRWVEVGGRVTHLKPGIFPAPGHYAESFLAAKFLTAAEKAAIALGLHMVAHHRSDPSVRTFGDLLRKARQPKGAIDKFWEPVIISACNLTSDRVAVEPAIKVFREGFLASARGAAIGVPSVPLVELYERAEERIKAAGGQVRLGCSVHEVGERHVIAGRGRIRHEALRVICALPFERLAAAVSDDVRRVDARIDRVSKLKHSPILGVHLRFDRPFLEWPHAVLVDRPTQWLFRKREDSSLVHAVVSGADDWISFDEQAIVDRVRADIDLCFPDRVGIGLVSARAVKEKRATFAATPESEELRPSVVGAGSRLLLAGDYTRTGWPATMEGAVRSGLEAAGAVLGLRAPDVLSTELKPGWLSRLLVRGLP